MTRFTVPFILLAACVAGAAAAPSGQQAGSARPDVMLQSAVKAETIDGDLEKAIRLYEELAGARDRRVAAEALLNMGRCYEKLGASEARRTYERLVRDFADQPDAAVQARARIAALEEGRVRTMTARRTGDASAWSEFGQASLAPDGTRVAFASYQQNTILIRDLASGDERTLPPPAGLARAKCVAVAFSPDGRELAASWMDYSGIGTTGQVSLAQIASAVVVAGLDGAKPRIVWRGSGGAIKLTWLPGRGGLLLALAHPKEGRWAFKQIGAADGRETPVPVTLEVSDAAALSPDGRTVAYLKTNAWPRGTSTLLVRSLESGNDTPVSDRVRGIASPVWTPDSRTLLYVDSRTGTGDLWAAMVTDGKPQLPARLVKADIGDVTPIGASRNGTFVYRARQRMVASRVVAIDPATGTIAGEPSEVLSLRKGAGCGHDWSPDGRAVIYAARAATDGGDECTLLVEHTLADHRERLVSTDLLALRRPRLSPDGRSALVVGTRGEGLYRSYRIDLTTGQSTPVGGGGALGDWLPDGPGLILAVGDGTRHRIVSHDPTTGVETERYSPAENAFGLYYDDLTVARDGTIGLLAIRGGDSKRDVVVIPPGGEPRTILATAPPSVVSDIAWSADGTSLWVVQRNADNPSARDLWRVPIDGGRPVKTGLSGDISGIRAHPDGRRMLFTSARTTDEIWTLENFLSAAK